MYRVVIIDDEEIIVRGLTQMLPWDKWDCEVAGSADNGAEGLKLIRQLHPDIVITDICMPQMDGLAMIAALRSEFPRMQIMILTGYSEFEYARAALHLGVTRLLVKPSKMDELIEAMDTMTANLKRFGTDSAAGTNGAGAAGRDGAGADTDACNETAGIEESAADAGESAADADVRSFIVRNALDFMREHYADKLRLEDVADHVYVSQWHLSKLLNRHTNHNFSEIMNEIRVDKAKELLNDPAYRIGDIAEQVGFMDMAHFSRVFKKLTGASPSEYRNG